MYFSQFKISQDIHDIQVNFLSSANHYQKKIRVSRAPPSNFTIIETMVLPLLSVVLPSVGNIFGVVYQRYVKTPDVLQN